MDIQAPTGALFKSVLSLVNRQVGGLRDWKNGALVGKTEDWDSHHIFPRRYLQTTSADVELVDTVANRAYIPKITNIKIGKKAPSVYLGELAAGGNQLLKETLESHMVDPEIASGLYDTFFADFVQDRAKRLFEAINRATGEAAEVAIGPFARTSE